MAVAAAPTQRTVSKASFEERAADRAGGEGEARDPPKLMLAEALPRLESRLAVNMLRVQS